MLHRSVLCQLLTITTILCLPLYAFGAPSLAISSGDGSTFTISASGVKGMSGLQFSVAYDSSSLSQPSVVQGEVIAGALGAVNKESNPIKGGFVTTSGFVKDGTVASITFKRLGNSSGTVSVSGAVVTADSRTVTMAASSYTPQPVGGAAGTTGNQTTSESGNGTADTTGGTSGGTSSSSGANWVGGTLTMPGDAAASAPVKKAQVDTPEGPITQEPPLQLDQPGTPPVDEPQQPVGGTPAEDGAAPEPAAEVPVVDGSQPQTKFVQHEATSVLERFRVFQGERTPQQLVQFFERGNLAFFTQSPPIGISDGAATVTVSIRGVSGEDAPIFALQGARSVKVTKGVAAGDWQVQARPEKGAVRATIVMMADGVKQELPLTVAPPARVDLSRPGVASEDDFRLFLKQRGTEQAPMHDLNGDGKRDYIDDYIFTANYLARGGIVSEVASAPAQRQDAAQPQGATQQQGTPPQQGSGPKQQTPQKKGSVRK